MWNNFLLSNWSKNPFIRSYPSRRSGTLRNQSSPTFAKIVPKNNNKNNDDGNYNKIPVTKRLILIQRVCHFYLLTYLCFDVGFCRILEFTPPLDGHALVNHVIRTISLDRQDACRVACYLDNDCLSYNFGRRPDGDYICQLSDSDHYQHPYDLKKSSDFIYRGTEVLLTPQFVA